MMRTWEQLTEEEQLLTTLSDMHKDVYGFRPRSRYNDMNVEQLRDALETLYEEADAEFAAVQLQQKRNTEEFATAASKVMDMCNCSFVDAVRYLRDAEGDDCDIDYFLWELDLTPEYAAELRKKLTVAEEAV